MIKYVRRHQAAWELQTQDPYMYSYSCTKHLSAMVADNTTHIEPYTGDNVECCYLWWGRIYGFFAQLFGKEGQ